MRAKLGRAAAALRSAATQPEALLALCLAGVLLFRFWLAAALPLTGDEAYYIDTGRHPDWGIYDHPAMIAWWLALLLQVALSRRRARAGAADAVPAAALVAAEGMLPVRPLFPRGALQPPRGVLRPCVQAL